MRFEHITLHYNPQATLLKLDRQLPAYHWWYPTDLEDRKLTDPFVALEQAEPRPKRRAVYIHVPFCETICTFCPFRRGEYSSEDEIDRYMRALLKEMEIKHEYDGIKGVPIDCIYLGGGSPSVLSTKQFYQLGEALHRYFDLSHLQEFSVECEVKSMTPEKLKAWQDIGVNRTSFGVQTFHPLYRKLFNLTSTVDQVRRATEWVNERFKFTNIDMIHSMAGQTLDDMLLDADTATSLGTTTVDYYTLNNSSSQPVLHRGFAEHHLEPLSANTRISYRMFLNEYLRAQGYVPSDGYAFTQNKAQPGSPRMVIQRDPIFLFQEISYGYASDSVDAYGPGAMGFLGPFYTESIANREQYAARLLSTQSKPWFSTYRNLEGVSKGVVCFPYRGFLEKKRVDWETIDADVLARLNEAISSGLAVEYSDRYELTDAGWLFPAAFFYTLMPRRYQEVLSQFFGRQQAVSDRRPDDVVFLPRQRTVVPAVPAS